MSAMRLFILACFVFLRCILVGASLSSGEEERSSGTLSIVSVKQEGNKVFTGAEESADKTNSEDFYAQLASMNGVKDTKIVNEQILSGLAKNMTLESACGALIGSSLPSETDQEEIFKDAVSKGYDGVVRCSLIEPYFSTMDDTLKYFLTSYAYKRFEADKVTYRGLVLEMSDWERLTQDMDWSDTNTVFLAENVDHVEKLIKDGVLKLGARFRNSCIEADALKLAKKFIPLEELKPMLITVTREGAVGILEYLLQFSNPLISKVRIGDFKDAETMKCFDKFGGWLYFSSIDLDILILEGAYEKLEYLLNMPVSAPLVQKLSAFAINLAAEKGFLKTSQLIQQFKKSSDPGFILSLASSSRLGDTKMLEEFFPIDRLSPESFRELCQLVAKEGLIGFLEFANASQNPNFSRQDIIDIAAENGNVEIVEYVNGAFPETFPSVDSLVKAMKFPYAAVLEWTFERQPQLIDIRVLRAAIQSGYRTNLNCLFARKPTEMTELGYTKPDWSVSVKSKVVESSAEQVASLIEDPWNHLPEIFELDDPEIMNLLISERPEIKEEIIDSEKFWDYAIANDSVKLMLEFRGPVAMKPYLITVIREGALNTLRLLIQMSNPLFGKVSLLDFSCPKAFKIWCKSHIPLFCKSQYVDALVAEGNHKILKAIQRYHPFMLKNVSEHAVDIALERGLTKVLNIVLPFRKNWDALSLMRCPDYDIMRACFLKFTLSEDLAELAIGYAVLGGHLNFLKFAQAAACPFINNNLAIGRAAFSGHLDVVEYFYQEDPTCFPSPSDLVSIAKEPFAHILEWVYNRRPNMILNNYEIFKSAVSGPAFKMNLDFLWSVEEAYIRGIFDQDGSEMARNGHLNGLRWYNEKIDWVPCQNTLRGAFMGMQRKVMEWIMSANKTISIPEDLFQQFLDSDVSEELDFAKWCDETWPTRKAPPVWNVVSSPQ